MTKKPRFKPDSSSGIPEITAQELKPHVGQCTIIDVRTPEEFTGELAHIPGSKLVPLGPELLGFLKTRDVAEELVFVCRSGARSGVATQQSRDLGFTATVNMKGGMILWNQLGYPIARNG